MSANVNPNENSTNGSFVTYEYLDTVRQLYDERFARDRELMDELSANQKQTTAAISEISKTLTSLDFLVNKHNDDIEANKKITREIEKRPNHIIEKITNAIITAVVGGLVSYIVAVIFNSNI